MDSFSKLPSIWFSQAVMSAPIKFLGDDSSTEFNRVLHLAEAGNSEAIYDLKSIQMQNNLSGNEEDQLLAFLNKKHLEDNLHATYCLGRIKDDDEGIELIQSAAEKGLPAANRFLGNEHYYKIFVTPNDFLLAINYYEAARAYPETHKKLAEMYRDGQLFGWGVKPDGAKAIACYLSLAKKWIALAPEAYDEIAKIYRSGKGGVAIDDVKARDYINKSDEAKMKIAILDKAHEGTIKIVNRNFGGDAESGTELRELI